MSQCDFFRISHYLFVPETYVNYILHFGECQINFIHIVRIVTVVLSNLIEYREKGALIYET